MSKFTFWASGFLVSLVILCCPLTANYAYADMEDIPEAVFNIEMVDNHPYIIYEGVRLQPVNGLAYYIAIQKKGEDYYGSYYLEVEDIECFGDVGAEEVIDICGESNEEHTESVPVEEEPDPEETIPLYRVGGQDIDHDLQRWAFNCLSDRGISWYYEYFIAQMFQESRWEQGIVSRGKFYGICQLHGDYLHSYKQMSGIWANADLVNDPYANIYVGVFLMSEKFKETSDLSAAISAYYTGSIHELNMTYVNDVLKWVKTLERIN